MKKRTARRRPHGAALLTLLLAAALAAAACSGAGRTVEPADKPAEPTALSVWIWPGSGLDKLIADYQDEHPDIAIDVTRFDHRDLHNNLQSAFAAGYGAPDIALIGVSYMERFKRLPGYFYNLGELATEPLKPRFLEWKWRQATSADESFVYGIPVDVEPIVMAFRPDIFIEAGLPYEREGLKPLLNDWDQFLAVGMRIKERTGKPMIDNIVTMYNVILGQASRQYFDQATGDFIGETNPAVRQAWEYAVKAKELGLSANMADTSAAWADGLENGDFAALLAPSQMLGSVIENAPGSKKGWDIMRAPGRAGNLGGQFLTITKESDHPLEAYSLIAWLTSESSQLRLFNESHIFPPSSVMLERTEILYKHDDFFRGAPIGKLLAETAKQIRPAYEGPYQYIAIEAMDVALTNVEDGLMSGDEAWESAMAEINEKLAAKNIGN